MIWVVDYDADWPRRFEVLRAELAEALAARGVPYVSIEHVGSTSVPGLAAKPVIDCDIIVKAVDVQRASEVLVELEFVPLGELGIPHRWAFKEPPRLTDANVYVIVEGSLALRNHISLREVLRADGSLRAEYASVKRRVAARAADIDEYGAGKSDAIQAILAKGGLSEGERRAIRANQVPSHKEVPR